MSKPMVLSELEYDLLTELFNISVSKAAASLSEMVNQEITLSVPLIELLTIEQVSHKLGSENSICSVSQSVSGPFSAQSLLIFSEDNSLEIVRQLMGRELPTDTLLELQKEAFSEIGNIVLNACIGSFSNTLEEEFKIDLPVYTLSKPAELLSMTHNKNEAALFIRIDLTLSKSKITGYMAFLMESPSFELLKNILKKMLDNL